MCRHDDRESLGGTGILADPQRLSPERFYFEQLPVAQPLETVHVVVVQVGAGALHLPLLQEVVAQGLQEVVHGAQVVVQAGAQLRRQRFRQPASETFELTRLKPITVRARTAKRTARS